MGKAKLWHQANLWKIKKGWMLPHDALRERIIPDLDPEQEVANGGIVSERTNGANRRGRTCEPNTKGFNS